jgi:hypothetical protein
MAEAQPQCRGWSNLGRHEVCDQGTLGRPEKAATIGPLQCSGSLTQWRQGALGSLRGHDHAQRGRSTPIPTPSYPVTGGALVANGSLARLFWRVFDDLDYWLLTQARLWLADAVYGPPARCSDPPD